MVLVYIAFTKGEEQVSAKSRIVDKNDRSTSNVPVDNNASDPAPPVPPYQITTPTDYAEIPSNFWKKTHTSNITF